MRVNVNGIIYARIYLLTIQPFICDCENLTRKYDEDNLGGGPGLSKGCSKGYNDSGDGTC